MIVLVLATLLLMPVVSARALIALDSHWLLSRSDRLMMAVCAVLAIVVAFSGESEIAIAIGAMGVCAIADARFGVVPDGVIVVAIVAIALAASGDATVLSVVTGSVSCCAGMAVIAIVARGAMGWGDVKLASVVGAGLGAADGATALALSFVAGGAVVGILWVARKVGRREAIPFAPFMLTGTVITLLIHSWGWRFA